jgi:hypothetical protein
MATVTGMYNIRTHLDKSCLYELAILLLHGFIKIVC